MTSKRIPRLVRADDFVAESLEARAKTIESFNPVEAESLRRSAKFFRESGRPGMMRLWEDVKEAEDFIRPDPASQP